LVSNDRKQQNALIYISGVSLRDGTMEIHAHFLDLKTIVGGTMGDARDTMGSLPMSYPTLLFDVEEIINLLHFSKIIPICPQFTP